MPVYHAEATGDEVHTPIRKTFATNVDAEDVSASSVDERCFYWVTGSQTLLFMTASWPNAEYLVIPTTPFIVIG